MIHRELLNESERPKVEEKCPKCECSSEKYSDYKVCFRENTNTDTIHIFCCKCKCEEYFLDECIDCKEDCTSICLCDCTNRAGHSNFKVLTFKGKKCFTLDEARIKAAELQNKGYKVCGVCVSALYHNGL